MRTKTQSITEKIIEVISKICEIPDDKIGEDTIIDQLQIDSFALIRACAELERHYNVEIDYDRLGGLFGLYETSIKGLSAQVESQIKNG